MRKVLDKRKFYVQTVIYILTIVAGWAFFNLIRLGAEAILLRFGVVSEAAQMGLIIAFVLVVFLALGLGFKKTLKKIMGK